MVEGEYRFYELKDFLVKNNLPLCVWISKNATRITSKIENDFISNTVVGFIMPFHDGLAKVYTFLSNSACAIGIYFQKNVKADYTYVIMVKPLKDGAPLFCVSIFGIDNRFNYSVVISRWNQINK